MQKITILKALKIRKKELDENHPHLANSYNNLGLLYKDEGDYEKAEEFYLKALRIVEKVLGENHPNRKIVRKNYEELKK
ncbi:MAG: tetratricopeptide repeat protein [Persephonella sp.]|nr:MAG: tetratricopeptide repeat protein [Persephonella sp.]RUM61402.1 MAG: tetratricopeptide repeat protein [Persephonella sp.]